MHEVLAAENFERDAQILTPHYLDVQKWTLHNRTFPIIDVTFNGSRPLRVRFTCDDWDETPPAIELLNVDGSYLMADIPGGVFNGSGHPNTNRPFVCMRGSREFHAHPSHLTDHWETYRGQSGMNLTGILVQLSQAWRKAVGR